MEYNCHVAKASTRSIMFTRPIYNNSMKTKTVLYKMKTWSTHNNARKIGSNSCGRVGGRLTQWLFHEVSANLELRPQISNRGRYSISNIN